MTVIVGISRGFGERTLVVPKLSPGIVSWHFPTLTALFLLANLVAACCRKFYSVDLLAETGPRSGHALLCCFVLAITRPRLHLFPFSDVMPQTIQFHHVTAFTVVILCYQLLDVRMVFQPQMWHGVEQRTGPYFEGWYYKVHAAPHPFQSSKTSESFFSDSETEDHLTPSAGTSVLTVFLTSCTRSDKQPWGASFSR